MENLEHLIKEKKLEQLIKIYTPEALVQSLSFTKALILSKSLLENENWDSDLQKFGIDLIEKLKQLNSLEWNKNWKHEAYLAYAYEVLGWDIEKEFDSYSLAIQKSTNPPLELAMHMALLWSYPGIYKIKMDEETAISILEKVAQKIPYMEAVGGLIRLYDATNQSAKATYWKNILTESEKKDLYDKRTYLDFFKDYE